MEHKGRPMFVIVELPQATLDKLDDEDRSPFAFRRAAIALCGKFKIAAGKKYFADEHRGEWPEGSDVSLDDLDYKEVTPPPRARPSTQQRAKRQ